MKADKLSLNGKMLQKTLLSKDVFFFFTETKITVLYIKD